MNRRDAALYVCLTLALISTGMAVYLFINQPRIAYVRSADLVYGYLGMKEAQSVYEAKKQSWQANVDTLKMDYRRALGQYNEEYAKLSSPERAEKEKLLQQQLDNLMQYSKAIEQKAKEEDEKMTQGVLNQVNSFVEGYGREHGYDVILGTTVSGNLLYAEEEMDITKELLNELNREYAGGKTGRP